MYDCFAEKHFSKLQASLKSNTMTGRILAWFFNILIVGYLLWKMHVMGSDKAPLLFMYYYPVIVFLNIATWLALKVFSNKNAKHYLYTSIALIVLAFPLYYFAGKY